jgi:hypothetical protein
LLVNNIAVVPVKAGDPYAAAEHCGTADEKQHRVAVMGPRLRGDNSNGVSAVARMEP